jgi:hypothetical protein
MCMGRVRNTFNILVNKSGRDHLGNLGTDGKIILKCVLEK